MIILENDMDIFEEQLMNEHYTGTVALSNIMRNPLSVIVANNEGVNYITSSSIENFMEANDMIDPELAINSISEANHIDKDSIVVVVDEANEFTIESLDEAGILMERAAEADATNLKKAMKWYDKFVKKSKDKAYSKNQLKSRIAILKKCKSNMEKALTSSRNGSNEGRIKYTLKQLIPFNSIYRLIKNDDVYAGLGVLGTAIETIQFIVNKAINYKLDSINMDSDHDYLTAKKLVSLRHKYDKVSINIARGARIGGLVLRATQYESMLERMIKNTSEAIDFLEKKLKEWED